MRLRWKHGLMLAMLVLQCACGFVPRGPVVLPFESIYVGMPERSALGGELRRQIRANGQTRLAAAPEGAQVVLEVLGEGREKQILSLNSQGRVREFQLQYSLRFRVRNAQGREFLPPIELVQRRTLSFNEAQVLAKEAEEAMLYRDMQADLVTQIMRRLAAMKVDG